MTKEKVRKALKDIDYDKLMWYFETNIIYSTKKGEKLC